MANMTHEEKDKVLADQQAEIEKLKAELEATNGAAAKENADKDAKIAELMAKIAAAEAKAAEDTADKTQEKVAAPKREKIFIPRPAHSKDDPNLVVGFNGKMYVLPKGKESEVPAEVAAEIRRSWRAADKYEETRAAELAKAAAAEEQMKQKVN